MKVFTSFISVLQTEQQILCQHKIGVCDFNVAYFVIVISFDKRKQNAAGIKKMLFLYYWLTTTPVFIQRCLNE